MVYNVVRRTRNLCCNEPPTALAIAFSLVIWLFATVPASSVFATSASAMGPGSTPRLNLIMPRGVQRGTEITLRFSGQRLNGAEEIFLYEDGVSVLELKSVDASNLDVRIKVESDCRLGEHVAQIRTSQGISDFRSFFVGPFTEVSEVEPNNQFSSAEVLQGNTTVNGTITAEDVDVFKVSAVEGQRLSVEIEAMRLGYWFDSFISIVDSENFEIAVSDDSDLNKQDGLISIKIPEDGDYFVVVREASYGGDANSRYRLHVGDFPRPTVVFPAGAKPDSDVELQFIGDPLGLISKKTTVDLVSEIRIGLPFSNEDGAAPSPLALLRSELENTLENEPNNSWKQTGEPTSLPRAFDGVISEPNDFDHFAFNANKGEVFDVECFARRLKSGLDPVINILNSKGRNVIGDDDARRPDCYLRFTVPETGVYFLRVRDHLGRGRPDFVYHVQIDRVKPKVYITLPRIDRFSQQRQQICVPRGNRFATLFNATKTNFAGELQIIAENLPEGIKMTAPKMVANLNSVPVLFEAAKDAKKSGTLAHFIAQPTNEKIDVVGNFLLLAEFSLGQPNNASYHRCLVEKLACAVTKKIPFSIEFKQPGVPLVRNGSMNLEVVVQRDEGFNQPITVQFPFRSPGVGTKPQIVIKKGESVGYYPVNANGNAQIGKWPVFAIGQANVNGPVLASTQLAELEIAQPYVTAEISRTACVQGEPCTIFCKLNHSVPFDGEATAKLMGVPPHIEIPPLKFTKDTSELSFAVTTTQKSPIGKHKGLFCRVTIPAGDESIVSTAGRSELQINKPQPLAVAKAQTESKPDVKPVTKPKSRLQQLRDAAKASRAQGDGGN